MYINKLINIRIARFSGRANTIFGLAVQNYNYVTARLGEWKKSGKPTADF
jgi:hypothetical protein